MATRRSSRVKGPGHYVIKHDLASLEAYPGRVWQVAHSKKSRPLNYSKFKPGDMWVAYAYETEEGTRDRASLVQGFYRCTKTAELLQLPIDEGLTALGHAGKTAWVIQGEPTGLKLPSPVLVPSIDVLLGRPTFKQTSVVDIKEREFSSIRSYVNARASSDLATTILGRTPKTEQELLVVFVEVAKKIGVSAILKAQVAFPDLLVRLASSGEERYIELELYSSGFHDHEHVKEVRGGRFKADGKKVCVVCAVDDDRSVGKIVPVYELGELLTGHRSLK